MLSKRFIFIFFLLLMVIGAMSTASANDLNSNVTTVSYDDGGPDICTIEDKSASPDTLLKGSNVGTFTELQNQINNANNASTIYLNKDYAYDTGFASSNGIKINKSITIDGKGHAIDGQYKSPLLLINQAQNVVLKDIVFKNGYNKDIGVINVFNSTDVKFENCIFTENSATPGTVILADTQKTSFVSCNFTGNGADYGTVYLSNDNYTSFVNCNFNENTAEYTGGALYMANSFNPSFKSCSFTKNYANDAGAIYLANACEASFVECNFTENEAAYTGGAIYLDSSCNTTFDSCGFSKNSANDAGAIYMTNTNSSKFSACDINNNFAERNGVIYMDCSHNTVFDSCNFINDTSCEYGGAAYLEYSNETYFNSCSFIGDDATNGGAIFANNTNTYLNLCAFEGNRAYNGGSVFVRKTNLHSTGSSFKDSRTYDEDGINIGGAIYCVQSALNFTDNSFEDNYGDSAGGDIYSQYCMVFIRNSMFLNSSTFGFGGSLSFSNDYVELENCTFDNSYAATNAGGAIYVINSILNITSSVFTHCDSFYGAAICSLNTDLTIKNDRFGYNDATYGGSIYFIYGTLTVEDTEFFCSYAYKGGGLYIRSPQKINSIANNRFYYCAASTGPRIYVDEYYGEIPQSGNIFEEIYFAVGIFNGSDINDEKYCNYSNILVYVLANTDDYRTNYTYDYLKNIFVSHAQLDNDINPDHEVSVTIFDEENPNDSIIYLNYDDFKTRTIAYDSHYSYDELNYITLTTSIYNLRLNEVASLTHTTIVGDEVVSNIFYSYNSTDTCGWWTHPIFKDGIAANLSEDNDGRTMWVYPISIDEFSLSINGEFAFDSEDRELILNLGSTYSFKNWYSNIPLINYTPTTDYLPSSYDSRDYGYITPVEDQSIGGNCWAFSGIATLEACLKKITGRTYDFSENNAKNLMATSSIYGLNIDPNAGGYDTMFIGYLASWLGPVYEVYDSYNPLSAISIDFFSPYHVQDIIFLPARKDSTDNDIYKSAIMNYGAFSAILDWTVNNISDGLHSICIIGWDDDYDGVDCLGNNAKGAWIFKNSWGKDWGDEGFGYLSYDEKLSEEIARYMHAYTFLFNERDIGYQDIYQYDFAGLTEFIYTDTEHVYYKNRFTAKQDEYISAFSTYFEKPTNFTYTITLNDKEAYTSEECHSSAGYHTIQMGEYVFINEGDEFEVIIKLTNDGGNSIPICQADDLYKLSYPSDVSFISYNGKDWIDIYELNAAYNFAYSGERINTSQIACIKAFTTPCSMNYTPYATHAIFWEGSMLSSVFSVYKLYGSQISIDKVAPDTNITLVIHIGDWSTDDYENEYYFEEFMQITVDNETYYVDIDGEDVYFTTSFDKEGNHTIYAKLNSNRYTSDTVQFNFNVNATGGKSSFGSFTELQKIISDAEDGDTIELDKDYYADSYFIENQYFMIINKNLTIDGKGHDLNGLSEVGIFASGEANCCLTFKNINFMNAAAPCAIYVYTAYLDPQDDSIIIYPDGELRIYNCNFTNNIGDMAGAISSTVSLTVINCNFENNECTDFGGGAVSSNGNSTIVNCTFKNNTAIEWGGAINLHYANDVDGENAIISNCTFINNYVKEDGAAIHTGIKTTISNCTFINNYAGKDGGAVYSFAPKCEISNSKFDSNYAENGGAISHSGNSVITDCDFKDNNAETGGAINSIEKNITIANSTFKNNTAKWGGAINAYGNMSIDNCNFTDNFAEYGGAIRYDNQPNYGHYEGDWGYYDEDDENLDGLLTAKRDNKGLTDDDDELEDEEDSGDDEYSDYDDEHKECYIINSNFESNYAETGGAIYSMAEMNITDCNFKNNEAENGGAITSEKDITLTNCNLTNNSAIYGGAIYSTSLCTIKNTEFNSNEADNSGGAIYSEDECKILNSTFNFNSATYGGAIISFKDMRIDYCRFENNFVDMLGGAVYSAGNCDIMNTHLKSNTAEWGGAIATINETNIYKSIFENNSADMVGGAIYSQADCYVLKSEFESNHAMRGGAISSNDGKTRITNSLFKSNDASYGGAVEIKSENNEIRNSTFDSNHAEYQGGAISCNQILYIYDSNFKNNTAKNGSAIYSAKSLCILQNATFDSNHAEYQGGAIYSGYYCIITYSTFNSNSAQNGGAIYAKDTSLLITASNFTNNEAITCGGSIYCKDLLNIKDSSFKSKQNREIIYCGNNLFELTNTTLAMSNENAAAIWYDCNKLYKAPLSLIFNNMTAIKGDLISVCSLEDSYGNTFRISDIVIMMISMNNGNLSTNTIRYNDTLGGYLMDTSKLDYGTYIFSGYLSIAAANYTQTVGVLNIIKSVLTTSGLTKAYGTGGKLTMALKDDSGNAIAERTLRVTIAGKTTTVKTDTNGQASMAVDLAPDTYTATISFIGENNYLSTLASTNVVIKKATPTITAESKTVKQNVKTKYTVTLKDIEGKTLKNAKTTITVNGKTYTAKTDSKGHATFTLKLTKGTHKATIKYDGDKYYNSASKTVTITAK